VDADVEDEVAPGAVSPSIVFVFYRDETRCLGSMPFCFLFISVKNFLDHES